jgi:membrane protease YdiL (CAAX protease family)
LPLQAIPSPWSARRKSIVLCHVSLDVNAVGSETSLKGMNPDEIPPNIEGGEAIRVEPASKISKWRWWVHLIVLSLLPVLPGITGLLRTAHADTKSSLPEDVHGLLAISVESMGMLAVLFGIAWLASRVNAGQLLLKWRGSWQPVAWGFVGSIVLRFAVLSLAATVAIFWMVIRGMNAPELQKARAASQHVVNAAALAHDPLYFALTLSLISFVVAGFREELWRAGMLAGLSALFPQAMSRRMGQVIYVCIIGVLFGFGHTIQGWAGVGLTTLLGIGLGAIMVWRQSIWEAVIAHGFFDASTFVFLYLLARYFPDALKAMEAG